MIQKIILCVISAVIGFLMHEAKAPVIELWIDVFGSIEEKALKDYQDSRSASKKDSLVQIALPWKAKQDSSDQAKKLEAVLCINREINRGKENPCKSTVYYFRVVRKNWLIGSTKCSQLFIPRKIPAILLDRSWVKRHFPYARIAGKIREVDIARVFGKC